MNVRWRRRIVLRMPAASRAVEVRVEREGPALWRSRIVGLEPPVARSFGASHPGIAAGKMLLWLERRFGRWTFVRVEGSRLRQRGVQAGSARKGETHG